MPLSCAHIILLLHLTLTVTFKDKLNFTLHINGKLRGKIRVFGMFGLRIHVSIFDNINSISFHSN